MSSIRFTQSPKAFQLNGMNIAIPTKIAGCFHLIEFLIVRRQARIPAKPNETTTIIADQANLPPAPLWSPKSRLILSDSTHSKRITALSKNTSTDQTGIVQDDVENSNGEGWISSMPINDVRTRDEISNNTIPSSTEGILSPRSFLPTREIIPRTIRAPNKIRISHW